MKRRLYKDLTPEQIERRRAAKRRYAERNAGHEKIRKAEYQRTERAAEIKRQWKKDNPEKVKTGNEEYRKNNPERIAVSAATWRRKHPHKVNAKTAKYRAGKIRATPRWADGDKIESVYKLARDLTDLTGVEHHVDHVVPLKSSMVCGLHCESNLQVLLQRENTIKHNRHWPDMP